MNLCLVADKNAEEVLYAYEYQGSVNDVAALASPVGSVELTIKPELISNLFSYIPFFLVRS